MLVTKTITEVFNMPVYTDEGSYFGSVDEAVLSSNKVHGWKIRATKNSKLSKIIGGAKGVIIPHSLVKAVGDIMVISKSAVPSTDSENEEE